MYLFDGGSPGKQARARELVEESAEKAIVSVQVLSEFYVAVTRKLERPLPEVQARAAVDTLCELQVRPLHAGLLRSAIQRSNASQLSYWDAVILETAIEAQASLLFTEDMQHEQRFDGLKVVNPFV